MTRQTAAGGAEIVGKGADNADTISIGLLSVGKGTAWVDSASFEIVPDGTPQTGAAANPASAPQNLSFNEHVPGAVPRGWFGIKAKGYSAEWRNSGCIGNLMQNFSAAAYRGKTVRLRAKLKLDAVDATDKAQMWLRVDRPDRHMGFFDNMNDRPVQTSTWTASKSSERSIPMRTRSTLALWRTAKEPPGSMRFPSRSSPTEPPKPAKVPLKDTRLSSRSRQTVQARVHRSARLSWSESAVGLQYFSMYSTTNSVPCW
jgi:hypothetical protein